jgi:hypothetical protein
LYEEKYGFIPSDLVHSSVSKALEFAYNYWAIARMAEDMGETELLLRSFMKNRSDIVFTLTKRLVLCVASVWMEAGKRPLIQGTRHTGKHPTWKGMHGSGPGLYLMMLRD